MSAAAVWSPVGVLGADDAKPPVRRAAPARVGSPARADVPKRTQRPSRTSVPRRGRGASDPNLQPRSTKPLAGEPWLVWESDTSDFGRILSDGSRIKGEFTFRNEGEADLNITQVQPSCGCTTVHYDRIVKPGQTGKIHYSIDPFRFTAKRSGGEGKGVKTVKVYSDSPGHPFTLLQVKGELYRDIDVKPKPIADFRRVGPKQSQTHTVDLVAKPGKFFEITKVESDASAFEAAFETVQKRVHYRVTIRTVPPLQPGYHLGNITVTTTMDTQKQVVIPVKAQCQARVYASMLELRLKPRAHTRTIDVSSASRPIAKVVKVTTSDPLIKTSIVTHKGTGRQRVQVFVPENYELPAEGSVVNIETDDEEFKILTVPFADAAGNRKGIKKAAKATEPNEAADAAGQ
jgi:hypothetical protein